MNLLFGIASILSVSGSLSVKNCMELFISPLFILVMSVLWLVLLELVLQKEETPILLMPTPRNGITAMEFVVLCSTYVYGGLFYTNTDVSRWDCSRKRLCRAGMWLMAKKMEIGST